MVLNLSEQAFIVCFDADASALQAPPGCARIDPYLFKMEGSYIIMCVAATHKSTECLQVLLDDF
jgi:hypothetical protein